MLDKILTTKVKGYDNREYTLLQLRQFVGNKPSNDFDEGFAYCYDNFVRIIREIQGDKEDGKE